MAALLSSKQYEVTDALQAIEFYFQRGWTDGLPVVPPTEERVREFLAYSSLPHSHVLGTVAVRSRAVTVEKVAINAVMAGCKAEYMPVVLAAVETILDDAFNMHGTTNSTGGAAMLLIINGPVRRKLGFNSGANLFGPGNRANATVGRAMRLVLLNILGATPGVLDRSTLGHPGQFTYCIAEDEDGSPWEPLHVGRGFSATQSAVTAMAAMAPWQLSNPYSQRPEEILTSVADVMLATGARQGEILVVIAPELMAHIKAAGWSRRQVQEFLHRTAQRTAGEWARMGRIEPAEGAKNPSALVPACNNPEDILVIQAGGLAGIWMAVVPSWAGGRNCRTATRPIDTSRL